MLTRWAEEIANENPENHPSALEIESTALSNLAPDRFHKLKQCLTSILASSLAEETFAQIIDGQPTRSSYERNFGEYGAERFERDEPSAQAVQRYRECKVNFVTPALKIEAKVNVECPYHPFHSHA